MQAGRLRSQGLRDVAGACSIRRLTSAGCPQVADFTGDGKADVLVRNAESGQWFLYPMNGRAVVSAANFGGVGITGNTIWETQ